MTIHVGANAKRLTGVGLAVVSGSGAVGPSKPASAAQSNRLTISTTVYPSPANAIPSARRWTSSSRGTTPRAVASAG